MNNFGEILKEHRLMRKLTLKDIEKGTGINNGSLSRWERNEVLPSITACIQLAEFFEVTLDELVGLENGFRTSTAAPMGEAAPTEKAKNEQERELLQSFRELSPYLQVVALDTVRSWASKPSTGSLHKKA